MQVLLKQRDTFQRANEVSPLTADIEEACLENQREIAQLAVPACTTASKLQVKVT